MIKGQFPASYSSPQARVSRSHFSAAILLTPDSQKPNAYCRLADSAEDVAAAAVAASAWHSEVLDHSVAVAVAAVFVVAFAAAAASVVIETAPVGPYLEHFFVDRHHHPVDDRPVAIAVVAVHGPFFVVAVPIGLGLYSFHPGGDLFHSSGKLGPEADAYDLLADSLVVALDRDQVDLGRLVVGPVEVGPVHCVAAAVVVVAAANLFVEVHPTAAVVLLLVSDSHPTDVVADVDNHPEEVVDSPHRRHHFSIPVGET